MIENLVVSEDYFIIFNDSNFDVGELNWLLRTKAGKRADMNIGAFVKSENLFHKRVLQVPQDVRNGIADRFPFCCIIHFCIDKFLKRVSGIRRGFFKNKRGEIYVPCFFCKNHSSNRTVNKNG